MKKEKKRCTKTVNLQSRYTKYVNLPTTRVWGVVVQGKGFGCDPICYLLKTCGVGSGPEMGLGLCSTHFCLVRVNSFKEMVQSQLKNCWLL
ncbi:hypothetical protein Lal_00002029 [Lupinus albus]|nr:hypothetical protein Lal_00002029 [Lupinus albus]